MTQALQPWEYLVAAAEANPDAPAIVTVRQVIPYRQLLAISARFARVLRDRGVKPGDIVALNVPSQLNSLLTWAVFHEAAIVCSYRPTLRDDEHVGPSLVVTTVPLDELEPERVVLVDGDFLETLSNNEETDEPMRFPSSDSICRVTFTSGTTGKPKAIAQTIGRLHRKTTRSWFVNRSVDRVMSLFPPADGPGWGFRYACVMGGMPYYVPESIPGIASLVHREKVREIVGSSGQITQLATYLVHNQMRLDGIDTVITGGSALPARVAEQVLRVTSAPYVENHFAATEVGTISILRKPTDNRNFVGTLVNDVGVQIVDPETHTPLPDGEVGAVRVTSPDIIDGYFHNPEATASNFRDGWFYTGDLGHLLGDEFYLDGRIAEIINAGGVKTNPTWVDEHVSAIPGVLECATFARYGATGLPSVACAVVLESDVSDDELSTAIAKELGAHAPREWYRVEAIPRTDMGKPRRGELTERYSESLPG